MLSFDMLQSGHVPIGGGTGQIHARSLVRLRGLVDRSLADVRLDAGIVRRDPISVIDLVAEIEIAGTIQAQARGVHFGVTTVDPSVAISRSSRRRSRTWSRTRSSSRRATEASP